MYAVIPGVGIVAAMCDKCNVLGGHSPECSRADNCQHEVTLVIDLKHRGVTQSHREACHDCGSVLAEWSIQVGAPSD